MECHLIDIYYELTSNKLHSETATWLSYCSLTASEPSWNISIDHFKLLFYRFTNMERTATNEERNCVSLVKIYQLILKKLRARFHLKFPENPAKLSSIFYENKAIIMKLGDSYTLSPVAKDLI